MNGKVHLRVFVHGRWKCKLLTILIQVKGKLKESINFWREELRAPDFLLDVIDHGYVVPLKTEPTPFVGKNHASIFANRESTYSSREYKAGKKRLVLNLRHLNRFFWMNKFKYEDLRTAMLLLKRGDYLFSFDLKSGYHYVEIAEVHHKYLVFAWNDASYVFTVLPFGLASACNIFTKLLWPLVRYWRKKV